MIGTRQLLGMLVGGLALCASGSVSAATIFVTNTSGNAAALQGDNAGTTTALPLDASDGGGNINLTTVSAYNGGTAQSLGMDAGGMGIGNAKWGNGPQGWIFTFDQPVTFDGIGYDADGGGSEGVKIESTAWANDTIDDTGQNWSFTSNGTVGTFTVQGGNGPLFDFSAVAGASTVPAGTQINIEHNSGNGGSQMTQFTISVVPEPGSLALMSLGGLLIARRRRA